MSNFDQFLKIRKVYAKLLPEWVAEYEESGEMRQDPYFMDWVFTPIEQNVWQDIRSFGLPFYPQMPVLNYFIDFGCPFLKIGIECDGKEWHNHDLDKARDARLAIEGWMIFRIEGHECKRFLDPWENDSNGCDVDEDFELIEKYFMTTSEGILSAIKRKYFDVSGYDKFSTEIDATLRKHRSTPETYPVAKAVTRKEPELVGDSLINQVERIFAKLRKIAA